MTRKRTTLRTLVAVAAAILTSLGVAHAQTQPGQYEPKPGQPGKDVVWVPNPPEMVEKMLDLAGVTPRDVVIDLGSGDGRNVIAAAKRGARARGVEYNPDLVEYSKRKAAEAGVADRASFVQGDMFEADFSDATVLALFLLPDNLRKLMPKFLELKPGTRIVANTFGLSDWTPASTTRMEEDCRSWCEAMLYIVPARVDGTWRLGDAVLELQQQHETIAGTLANGEQTAPLENVRIRADEISFSVAGSSYSGRVKGDRIEGSMNTGRRSGRFVATRR
jgi:precorrin-6B methylase 2